MIRYDTAPILARPRQRNTFFMMFQQEKHDSIGLLKNFIVYQDCSCAQYKADEILFEAHDNFAGHTHLWLTAS